MTATAETRRVARDIMTPDPVTLDPSDTMEEIARVLDANGISGVPVINAAGILIGVVTKTDLIHRCLEGPSSGTVGSFFELLTSGGGFPRSLEAADLGTVEDLMTSEVVVAAPNDPIAALAHRMAENSVHRLIIVDAARRPIGVVTALDVLRAYPI